jgi:peptidoglycan/xylan/chitin deacetylase (PgdA/CDA1 family)
MLKRFLILACGLALFITAFFIHQYWVDAKLEGRFRAEREKFNVDGQELVTTAPPVAEPLTPTPPPLPVVSTGNPDGSVPTVTPSPAAPGSPTDVPLDTNTLIGPVPPAPAGTPTDIKTPTVPATPATNASPDSTLLYPGGGRLPLLLLGSYGLPRVQAAADAPAVPATPAPEASPASAPATNSPAVPPVPAIVAEPKVAAPSHMPASVIVLGYHQFSPPGVRAGGKMIYTMPADVFETEMKYLADNHYNVVPLSDVVAFAKKEKTLPPNTVAITIDDGYKSPLVFAAPVLKKYNFPWTFFVYPSFIGNHPTSTYRGAASWPELIELQKEGVDIECHSMTHPQLTRRGAKTPEQYDAWLTNETVTSKSILETKLGKTIKYFAYPYGEYNKTVEAKTISAGYDAIFTVANNPIHPGTNVYAMGRYIITAPVEKAYVSYLHEGALGLANIVPAPGSTVNDPRPVISAALGYDGNINPKSIVAEVSNMGEVRFDFDPKSLMLRLYLPRDLIDPAVKVNIYAKDADTGKTMVASWRFNYQPTATGVHAPIGAAPAGTNAAAPEPAVHLGVSAGATNSPAVEPAPSASSKATPVTGKVIESSAVPAVPATAPATNATP